MGCWWKLKVEETDAGEVRMPEGSWYKGSQDTFQSQLEHGHNMDTMQIENTLTKPARCVSVDKLPFHHHFIGCHIPYSKQACTSLS